MILGHRPVTSIAILSVLNDAAGVALHGMQIGRELESRFKVQEGWFTRTWYYSDRVGKLLPLLVRLNMIREVAKKDLKGRREFVAYQLEPSVAGSVRDRLGELSKGNASRSFVQCRPLLRVHRFKRSRRIRRNVSTARPLLPLLMSVTVRDAGNL